MRRPMDTRTAVYCLSEVRRQRDEALDPMTLIRVGANRYGSGGETLLYFHGEYSRFDSIEDRHS